MKNYSRLIRILLRSATCAVVLSAGFTQHLNAQAQIVIPTPKLPSPNAFDFYRKAFETHVERPNTLIEGYDPKTESFTFPRQTFEESLAFYRKPELLKRLEQNQTALQTLRQGFQHEYHQPAERPSSTPTIDLWPYFARARGMTRTLVTESHIRAGHGDWQSAANSALDGIRMGHDIARGSTQLGARCSYAHQSMARAPLKLMLPHLDAKTYRMAARQLEQLHKNRVPLHTVLSEQKWAIQAILLDAMKQKDWQKIAAPWLNDDSTQPWRPRSKEAVMSDYTALMDSCIALAKQPYGRSAWPKRPTGPVMSKAIEPYYRLRWHDTFTALSEALLTTALALRAYQLEQGTSPENLGALVPGYLNSVPIDPIDNQPLRYKKQGENYVLWSIGPDGKNDGGLFATSYSRDQEAAAKRNKVSRFYMVTEDSKGDFVFGINR